MLNSLMRLITGKSWSWLWVGITASLAVVDLMTGHMFLGLVMTLLAVYWANNLRTIYNGTNKSYNEIHKEKV